MGDSKFFTNHETNTLFDKFKGIIEGMVNLHNFHAVVGYFRSSGYFKIRQEFEAAVHLPKIQILVGINIDNIFRKHNKNMLFMSGERESAEAYKLFQKDFVADVRLAGYHEDIEKGILMLADDLQAGRVELKVHPTRDLHAKFYLFLPQNHTPHSDGWVIMGSSNLSESGLGLTQPPRYELNVAMKDYDEVAFCKSEFDKLWKEGLPLTFSDIERYTKQTHIGQTPTPYELYMKLLIDYFGDRIDDNFTLEIPSGFKDLKYQKDAVSQGYQMLCKYNGVFLADVVGLGKTVVATMIAKRFIEENGIRNTRALVVYPPAVAENWKSTFEEFKIERMVDFISCGSLEKVLKGEGGYRYAEEYDLILVDEAHRFRSDNSQMYDCLQRICKTDREYVGSVGDRQKKVMLISATPLNNRPDDIYNLLQLFQDKRRCKIDGISNLQNYFAPKIAMYKELTSRNLEKVDVEAVKILYDGIRNDVIDKVTVRRTRQNIMNCPEYAADLDLQGIIFPKIEQPRKVKYVLHGELKELFYSTMEILTDKLKYARYTAISKFEDNYASRYPNAKVTAESLAHIYRTHMVKRLESSFCALRRSLDNLRNATQYMVDMYNADKVIIAPELKVTELQDKGIALDEIIEKGIEKFGIEKEEFVYPREAFKKEYIDELKNDIDLLDELRTKWKNVTDDPKLDRFVELLEGELFDKKENPTGKLVVFSESKDTINYLKEELTRRLGRNDILTVSANDRRERFDAIQANFDANYQGKKKNDYNIIISTDVLAEGVNLHRSNVIVNYDTPWNATRLMQRIGRVNRIGSVAGTIVNYSFYPSDEGDKLIKLYKNALAKLQGFHSAYGEDSQIYSEEEIVEQFQLFNANVRDDVDKSLELLRVVRDFKAKQPEWFERIGELPIKSRTARSVAVSGKGIEPGSSLVYIASPYKKEFYKVEGGQVCDIGFMDVITLFEALPEEKPLMLPSCHYKHVSRAHALFDEQVTNMMDDKKACSASEKDSVSDAARNLLRKIKRECADTKIHEQCDVLQHYVEQGTYAKLTRELSRLERKYRKETLTVIDVKTAISGFVARYHKKRPITANVETEASAQIILSETFV